MVSIGTLYNRVYQSTLAFDVFAAQIIFAIGRIHEISFIPYSLAITLAHYPGIIAFSCGQMRRTIFPGISVPFFKKFTAGTISVPN